MNTVTRSEFKQWQTLPPLTPACPSIERANCPAAPGNPEPGDCRSTSRRRRRRLFRASEEGDRESDTGAKL